MAVYSFLLRYSVNTESSELLELLSKHCSDAVVGVGRSDRIAIDFMREADNAGDAICSALSELQSVLPSAVLIEVAFNNDDSERGHVPAH